jgi:LPS export ABC transporter protein LptC
VIWRVLFALISVTALSALLYLRQSDTGADTGAAQASPTEPGYVAIHGELVETGDDGHALYRLVADRIEQPSPRGMIYLTAPRLDYQADSGDHWTLTAQRGQVPQEADYADLTGNVHAEGHPNGSPSLMRIDSDVMHLNMPEQIATTSSKVTAQWAGRMLSGRGMRYQMKRNDLELQADVHGAIGR